MRMPTVHPKTEEREADKFKMSMRKKIWRLICGSHWYRSQKLVQFPSLLLSCGIVYWLRIFPCADIYHCNWGKNTGFLWGCSFPDCPGNIISLGWTHGSENKCVGVISLFCYCSFYIWESLFLSPAFCLPVVNLETFKTFKLQKQPLWIKTLSEPALLLLWTRPFKRVNQKSAERASILEHVTCRQLLEGSGQEAPLMCTPQMAPLPCPSSPLPSFRGGPLWSKQSKERAVKRNSPSVLRGVLSKPPSRWVFATSPEHRASLVDMHVTLSWWWWVSFQARSACFYVSRHLFPGVDHISRLIGWPPYPFIVA